MATPGQIATHGALSAYSSAPWVAIKAGTILPVEETAPAKPKKKEATLITAAELAAHKEAMEAASMAMKRSEIAKEQPTDRTAVDQAATAKEEAESVFAKLNEIKKEKEDEASESQ